VVLELARDRGRSEGGEGDLQGWIEPVRGTYQPEQGYLGEVIDGLAPAGMESKLSGEGNRQPIVLPEDFVPVTPATDHASI
jgi:hypothetical protein